MFQLYHLTRTHTYTHTHTHKRLQHNARCASAAQALRSQADGGSNDATGDDSGQSSAAALSMFCGWADKKGKRVSFAFCYYYYFKKVDWTLNIESLLIMIVNDCYNYTLKSFDSVGSFCATTCYSGLSRTRTRLASCAMSRTASTCAVRFCAVKNHFIE